MESLVTGLALLLLAGVHHIHSSPLPDVHKFTPLAEPVPVPQDIAVPPELADYLSDLESFLTELLIEDPWRTVGDPLVYVTETEVEADAEAGEGGAIPSPWKRGRYYRRYPWKRQNGRHYDPDGFMCAPSKEDVFQLLVALHDAKGGKDRVVHFCNRRRPARAIFTNIRFLGRKK